MTEETLKYKIKLLSENERKLLGIKINDFVQKEANDNNSENKKKIVTYLEVDSTFNTDQLIAYLKNKLPDYMIPSSFFKVEKIPLLPNGKVDNKALLKMKLKNTDAETNNGSIVKPTTETEEKLVKIWEEVLDFSPISTHDNFFEIGGDSILSIQIISKARKAGIELKANQIFENQTIAELSLFSKNNDSKTLDESILEGEVSLNPIQHWFFNSYKTAPHFWNQGFTIKNLPEHINKDLLQNTTEHIIKKHDALRLSFNQKSNIWKGNVREPNQIDAFSFIDLSHEPADNHQSIIETTLMKVNQSMRLEDGSLFKCIYFETGQFSNNRVVLLAHHLVVDFVSWQIIINDYNTVISSGSFESTRKTASIKRWSEYLLEKADSNLNATEFDYWNKQISNKNALPLDYECELPVSEKDTTLLSFSVDKTTTNNLHNKANEAYSTKIVELLLTALVDVITNWTKTESILLGLEGHGRDTEHSNIDLSNTVGWFTAFYPKLFKLEPQLDMGSKIVKIKEQFRSVPNGGIGYGILRYLTSSIEKKESPEIIFNFLGKQNSDNNSVEVISKNVRHPLSERHYFLEINALIIDDQLQFNWTYSNMAFKDETIELLVSNFNRTLKELVEHCLGRDTIKYTPSDFEDINLDQDDLDSLLNDIDL